MKSDSTLLRFMLYSMTILFIVNIYSNCWNFVLLKTLYITRGLKNDDIHWYLGIHTFFIVNYHHSGLTVMVLHPKTPCPLLILSSISPLTTEWCSFQQFNSNLNGMSFRVSLSCVFLLSDLNLTFASLYSSCYVPNPRICAFYLLPKCHKPISWRSSATSDSHL